jgi:glycosyltransferase involved in cell wall biosynthesis
LTLIVHAPNIHTGGGRALLVAIVEGCSSVPCTLIVDERLPVDMLPGSSVRTLLRIAPTLRSRLKAERLLRKIAKPTDVVLCMGNLPPLLPLSCPIFVFVQNRYLVEATRALDDLPIRVRVRIRIERLWLRLRRRNARRFIVQTQSMREALKQSIGCEALIAPFLAAPDNVRRAVTNRKREARYDFVYVATGEAHKNHRVLVRAWVELAHAGLRPHLCLTISRSRYGQLADWIEHMVEKHGLRITNVGEIAPEQVRELYRDSAALVFPSVMESFGLPLVEARQAGLPIVAAELDYVRDLVDPEESFDPGSPRSLARAVARFLGESQESSFMLPSTFIQSILAEAKGPCTYSS